MKPPVVKSIQGAFDGEKGGDASFSTFTACSQEIYKQDIPRPRAVCDNEFETFNGSDFQFNFQLLTANAGYAAMPVDEIKNHLKVRANDNLWNIDFWKNRSPISCNNENCIVTYDDSSFDFYAENMDMNTLSGTVSSLLNEKLESDEMKKHVQKEFARDKLVLESVNSHDTRFVFGENNEFRAGFSEAWDHVEVAGTGEQYGWADKICKNVLPPHIQNWVSPDDVFQQFRGGVVKYESKTLPGYNAVDDGSISKKVNLNDYMDLRYVKLVSAGISQPVSSGSSELSVIPFISESDGRGAHYADFEQVEQPNGDVILSIPSSVLKDMSPVTESVVIEGSVGGKGFSSPSASIMTGFLGNISEDLKSMAGDFGVNGESWIKNDFYPGRATWRATYENGESLPNFLYVPTATGKGACDVESLQKGICQYEYFPKRVSAKKGDKFDLTYHVSELEGEVHTPYKGFNSIEGIHIEDDKSYQAMSSKQFLSLYGINPELVTKHGFFETAELDYRLGRGSRNPGSDGNSVSLRYFEGGTGATGFYSLYDVEDPQVRPHGIIGIAVGVAIVGGIAAYTYGNRNTKKKTNTVSMSFANYVKSHYTKNNDGIYEIRNDSVITTSNPVEIECNTVVKSNDDRFYDKVLFTPQYLPASLSREKFDEDNFKTTGLERGLDLSDSSFRLQIQAKADRFFPQNGEFSEVVTSCDDEYVGGCKTEFKFLSSKVHSRLCNGVFTGICFGDGNTKQHWEQAVVHWFSGRQGEYVGALRDKCSEAVQKGKTSYESSAKEFVNGLESDDFKGILSDLLLLKPSYFKAVLGGETTIDGNPVQFNPMYEELQPFADRYFTVEDLPANIQKFVRLKKHDYDYLTLPELYAVASRLSSYSDKRRQLDDYLRNHSQGKHQFSWENLGNVDLPGDAVDNYVVNEKGEKITLLKEFTKADVLLDKVYKQWNKLPSVEEFNRLLREISNVINILRPKVRKLACAYSINGTIKKYEKPYFKKESVNFINPSKHVSKVELSSEKWENTFGEKVKVVKIRAFETTSLNREVRFTRSKTGRIGEVVEPAVSIIPTCADLGNLAWDKGIPMARIMHQRKDCGAN